MIKKNFIISLVLLLIVISSCNQSNKQETINLRLDWFLNMSYAGEVFASKIASDKGIKFEIAPASENTDPLKMVISGQNNFGVVSADKFIAAVEKGAEIVAIGVKNPVSPVVFLSKKEKNILEPKNFEGNVVGILPGGSTEYVYRTLLKKQNVNVDKIKEVTASFDLSTFIADKYDVRPAFIYDEPVSLDLQNIQYNIIEPKKYDVNFIGGVYFTTKEMIKNNPELVQQFINLVAEGWEKTIADPQKAISYIKEMSNQIDESRELKSLNKGLSYFKNDDGKVLVFSKDKWNDMVNSLKILNVIKNINIDECTNDKFINKYYSK